MKKASVVMSRLRSAAGFTLVELIAAVALLVILLAILFVVFRSAGETVVIGQDRVECYRSVRAIFRLLEEDITNAFLMTEDGTTYGFTGENAVASDGAFLDPAPDGDSDRLTLIRPRKAPKADEPGLPVDPEFADEPGFMVIRYSRFTYDHGDELAGDRRHYFFRAVDDDIETGWRRGDPLVPELFRFDRADPDPMDSDNDNYYRN
ncbi:MAG: prepilin-type N-terminal cleavage/methylation domain-containing protein, partial [Planctomycetes bacterium]|nr:prepilin-type N-terminal cleavage/methylation domain-containing protein [Planctomycetota bacterium]